MPNRVKNIGITIFAAIYCFTVSAVTILSISSDHGTNPNTTQEQYVASISNNLFCHTSPSESSVNIFNNFPGPNLDNRFDNLWSLTKSTEGVREAQFIQYSNFSINLLIQHRISDLIFPFHYFW